MPIHCTAFMVLRRLRATDREYVQCQSDFRMEIFTYCWNQAPNCGFVREKGVMLNFDFVMPKRHILAQNRTFWHILRQCPWWHFGCGLVKNQKSGVNILVHKVTHEQKQNPLSDLDEILQGGRYLWCNHLRKFRWWSVKRLRGGGGQMLPFAIFFCHHPYNTLALPCECVILALNSCNDFHWQLKVINNVILREITTSCLLSQ